MGDDPLQKYCVVCGMGSHRADWQSKTGAVACDWHTKDEVSAALAKLNPTPPPAPAPPPKPS
jgi:hypothetical protein